MSNRVRRPDESPKVGGRPLRFELDPLTSMGGTLCTKPIEIFDDEGITIGASARHVGARNAMGTEAASIGLLVEQSQNRIDWYAPAPTAHLTDRVQIELEEPSPRRWIRLRMTSESHEAANLRASVWGFARRAP